MGAIPVGTGADTMVRPNITGATAPRAAIMTGTADRTPGLSTAITTSPRLATITGRTAVLRAGRSMFTIDRFIIPIIIPNRFTILNRSAASSSRQPSTNRDWR